LAILDAVRCGRTASFEITLRREDGTALTGVYSLANTLSARAWVIDGQAQFSPTVAWKTNDPTLGIVVLTFDETTTAQQAPGVYQVEVGILDAGKTVVGWEGLVELVPGPGAVAVTGRLASYGEARAFYGADVAQSLAITGLLDTASELCREYCRREFGVNAVTELLDGPGRCDLLLGRPPVSALSTIEIDDVAIDLAEVQIDSKAGILYREDGWPCGRKNIRVSYSGGYTDIPGPIKHGVLIVARFLLERGKISGAFEEERIGDYAYKLRGSGEEIDLPKTATKLWDLYQLPL
jgi:hypothetical protein